MSTRCNIIVMTEDGDNYQFYHHCDGYPEGVGIELVAMAQVAELTTKSDYNVFAGGRIYSEELVENFLNIIRKSESYEDEGEIEKPNYNKLHGDIEYLYVVKINIGGIKVIFREWNGFDDENDKIAIIKLNEGNEAHFNNLSIKIR